MGYREITITLPTNYIDEELRIGAEKELGIKEFSYRIVKKSLDARKRSHIHWKIRIAVVSEEIRGNVPFADPPLKIPCGKRREKALVVGSGPAGFFSAFVLQKAGFTTMLIERGSDVDKREAGIQAFERTGVFNATNNYAFGEGGAGTFSDGKLTSRSKHIKKEREFILSSYIRAGAPEEIRYLAYPHLGSDKLKKLVKNLREEFLTIGGTVLFETVLEDVKIAQGKVYEVVTSSGGIGADIVVIASGHSAYETYRLLIRKGVKFRTKNFALGCRVEHPQEFINRAQWGRDSLPGVNAAEYRLTSKGDGKIPVYTFCMCPGGIVVPASAYENTNIVNGMSIFRRNGKFANAACVAGVNPAMLIGEGSTSLKALDWLESLEERFYRYADGFRAPYCLISDFINRKEPSECIESSYPLGLMPAALWELLPFAVSSSIREGLKDFCRKIKGFETGSIMGLESKTSSVIQVLRERNGLCAGFENLYMVGEGSGYAGGILSSGADGIKAAMSIAGKTF
ncbi:MAG: FAD-dependent monooxygenase [Deltaproteobacteria bacterium]|nr:FAD-dependent monooxygenase [Deltaproteobacteria bacterium]